MPIQDIVFTAQTAVHLLMPLGEDQYGRRHGVARVGLELGHVVLALPHAHVVRFFDEHGWRSAIIGKRRAAASTSSTSVSRPYSTVSLKSLKLSSTTVFRSVLTISVMKKGSSPCRT